jgi:spore germination protein KB
MNNYKISSFQIMVLAMLFTSSTSTVMVPSLLAELSGKDAWIAAIIGVVLGLLFPLLYVRLASRHTNLNLVELIEKILGKRAGKLISFLFFLHFLILGSGLVRHSADFLLVNMLGGTPIEFLSILIVLIIVFAARSGLEVIARAAEIFFPWVVFLFLLLIIVLVPEMDLSHTQPIFENGIKPILHGSFVILGTPFLDMITFLVFFSAVNNKKQAGKALIVGTFLGGVVLIINVCLAIFVLGDEFAARSTYALYTLAKQINIGGFLNRIEAIVAVIWFLSAFFKMTLSFYAAVVTFAQVMNLKEYRSVTFPFGIFAVILSLLLFPNMSYFDTFVKVTWTPYLFTYGLFIPVVLLIIDSLKRKKKV